MDWTGTFLGDTRAELLRLLRRSKATIGELAASLGVTGNAVRGHLATLQRDGLVEEVGARPSTGGKPAQLYDLTPTGEEVFPKAYGPVLQVLIRALRERDGDRTTVELLRVAGRSAAPPTGLDEHATPEERTRHAAEALKSLGGDVEVERVDDGWLIRGFGCPLSAVVKDEPDACRIAEGLVSELTGAHVEEHCDRRGTRACCAFFVPES
jgi:predicted ArsR family transcriptional regulator